MTGSLLLPNEPRDQADAGSKKGARPSPKGPRSKLPAPPPPSTNLWSPLSVASPTGRTGADAAAVALKPSRGKAAATAAPRSFVRRRLWQRRREERSTGERSRGAGRRRSGAAWRRRTRGEGKVRISAICRTPGAKEWCTLAYVLLFIGAIHLCQRRFMLLNSSRFGRGAYAPWYLSTMRPPLAASTILDLGSPRTMIGGPSGLYKRRFQKFIPAIPE
jgi:hypothetical protein